VGKHWRKKLKIDETIKLIREKINYLCVFRAHRIDQDGPVNVVGLLTGLRALSFLVTSVGAILDAVADDGRAQTPALVLAEEEAGGVAAGLHRVHVLALLYMADDT
jgi:hypothetical protein